LKPMPNTRVYNASGEYSGGFGLSGPLCER